jgi:hypothetical protein
VSGFTVEEWDKDETRPTEVIATANNIIVAQAAFGAAIEMQPNRLILLRQGIRIVKRHTSAKRAG